MSKFSLDFPVSLPETPFRAKLVLEGSYSPGTPDVMYLPNGDPGYPGDPAELELEEAHLYLLEGNDPRPKHKIDLFNLFNELSFTAKVLEEIGELFTEMADNRIADEQANSGPDYEPERED